MAKVPLSPLGTPLDAAAGAAGGPKAMNSRTLGEDEVPDGGEGDDVCHWMR